jgi:hypothetical protein
MNMNRQFNYHIISNLFLYCHVRIKTWARAIGLKKIRNYKLTVPRRIEKLNRKKCLKIVGAKTCHQQICKLTIKKDSLPRKF